MPEERMDHDELVRRLRAVAACLDLVGTAAAFFAARRRAVPRLLGVGAYSRSAGLGTGSRRGSVPRSAALASRTACARGARAARSRHACSLESARPGSRAARYTRPPRARLPHGGRPKLALPVHDTADTIAGARAHLSATLVDGWAASASPGRLVVRSQAATCGRKPRRIAARGNRASAGLVIHAPRGPRCFTDGAIPRPDQSLRGARSSREP